MQIQDKAIKAANLIIDGIFESQFVEQVGSTYYELTKQFNKSLISPQRQIENIDNKRVAFEGISL